MFEKVNVPVLGLIENMSYFISPDSGKRYDIFGHGGAANAAAGMGMPFLGEVPLDMAIRELRNSIFELTSIDDHEDVHVWQARWFGPLYPVLYVGWLVGAGAVGVVVWMWARHGQRPTRLTLVGGSIALAGLALLIDVVGGDMSLDPRGVAWALAAMVGATAYFVISGHGESGVPPVALAWFGLTVAAVTVGIVGLTGALPLHAAGGDVAGGGENTPRRIRVLAGTCRGFRRAGRSASIGR